MSSALRGRMQRDWTPGRNAPFVVAGLAAGAAIACAGVVTSAVTGIADAFLLLPALADENWIRRVLALTSQEFSLGTAAAWLLLAAGLAATVGLAARIAPTMTVPSIARLIPAAVLGVALLAVGVVLAPTAVAPTLQDAGALTLFTGSEARGFPALPVTLGSAGVIVLATVGGMAAARHRRAAVACAVVAVVSAGACVRTVLLAAEPFVVLRAAPSYPAQVLHPDVVATALTPPLALGAVAFGIAALAGSVVRMRRRETSPRSFVGESERSRLSEAPTTGASDETAGG